MNKADVLSSNASPTTSPKTIIHAVDARISDSATLVSSIFLVISEITFRAKTCPITYKQR